MNVGANNKISFTFWLCAYLSSAARECTPKLERSWLNYQKKTINVNVDESNIKNPYIYNVCQVGQYPGGAPRKI